MIRINRIIWPVGLAVVLAGCPSESDKAPPPPPPPSDAPASAPADTPDGAAAAQQLPKIEGPVATVNGVPIGADKFLAEYKTTLDRYQRARHPVKPELRERLKDNLVRRLVDAEIIMQQASKLKVTLDKKTSEEKWAAHKKRYGSDEAFKNFLQRAGTTEVGVREQFELNLIREQVFATVSDSIVVESAEIKKFYEDNKKRYNDPEQVRASHILLRIDAKLDEAGKKKKRAEANKIAKQAKKSRGKFAALAKKYGEDPTRGRGGDLGFFTRGRMVKAFEDAVWNMKKGAVSDVVETNFGFHIIKKTGHKKAHQKSFKEVKEQIERAVRARKRNTAIRDALKSWKEEAKIEIMVKGDPAILSKAARPGPSGLRVNTRPNSPKNLPLQKATPPPTTDKPVQHK